jgi:hypothetical protein
MGILDFINKISVQKAVYWAPNSLSNEGMRTFSIGVEISCRWDDTIEVVRASNGQEIVCKAKILTTTDLLEQGYLYRGTLASLSVAQKADPRLVETAYEIRRVDKAYLIKSAIKYVQTVYL